MVSNVVSSHYQSLRAPVRQAGGHWFEPSTAHTRAPAPSLAQARAGQYPDGLAYDPVERHVFVSDERGGVETVIDAAGRRIATIPLGGGAGNVQYRLNIHHPEQLMILKILKNATQCLGAIGSSDHRDGCPSQR